MNTRVCITCNNSVSLLDKFCSKCGNNIFKDNYMRCLNCDMIYFPKDKYCSKCGNDLNEYGVSKLQTVYKQYKLFNLWKRFWSKK